MTLRSAGIGARPVGWSGARSRHDAGTVTAELAVALPGVVLLAVALLVTGQAVIGEVRCTDAARAGARLAARGEPASAVLAEATRLAPPGSQVGVSRTGDQVRVEVSSPLGAPAPTWARLTMRASAVASVEAGYDPESVGALSGPVDP